MTNTQQNSQKATDENKDTTECVVDLSIIRIYCSNIEDEREFVGIFIKQSEECMDRLIKSCAGDDDYEWLEASHKLKGNAAGMGAEKLIALCDSAQSEIDFTHCKKEETLESIKSELSAIMHYLQSQDLC